MGPGAMTLGFWMLSFNPTFSLSSFTFIKRLFSSSSLFAIRVVSSAYLRLLIFLLAILIPACAFVYSNAKVQHFALCRNPKGTTEDGMAGWPHWLDGRESEWTPGVGDGQRGLACCDSWGCKEVNTTEQLNWTELKAYLKNIKELIYQVDLTGSTFPDSQSGVLSTK